MKKGIKIFVAVLMVLSFTACKGKSEVEKISEKLKAEKIHLLNANSVAYEIKKDDKENNKNKKQLDVYFSEKDQNKAIDILINTEEQNDSRIVPITKDKVDQDKLKEFYKDEDPKKITKLLDDYLAKLNCSLAELLTHSKEYLNKHKSKENKDAKSNKEPESITKIVTEHGYTTSYNKEDQSDSVTYQGSKKSLTIGFVNNEIKLIVATIMQPDMKMEFDYVDDDTIISLTDDTKTLTEVLKDIGATKQELFQHAKSFRNTNK